MAMTLSTRQLALLALAIAVVVAAVVVATMSLTRGADSPAGETFARGTLPWAI